MRTLLIMLSSLFITLSSAQSAEQIHRAGETWVNKSKKTSGSWKIVEEAGLTSLILQSDFKTSKGPDLKLFLHAKPMGELGKKDPVEATGKLVGELQSAKGEQRYPLPSGVKLDDYKSLVIHCEKYTIVWGGVDLK
ncbi:MAG: hypothetical protein ACI9TH_000264 [Kiritimatiellia bacterium]|jgi:hypothetical protein